MTSELCPQGELQNRYVYSRIQMNAANTAVNKLIALNIETEVI